MKSFFRGVRRHIGKLDANHLREQYELIAEEAASLDKVFDTINRGLVVLDAHGDVTRSNKAARELLGADLAATLADLRLPLGQASRRDLAVSYPEKRVLELQTFPFEHGTIVFLRDATAERRRTEEELAAGATRAVCDLAAGVAHEIGNPLNAIAMSLQLLKRDPADVETIDVCMNQVKRLNGIVRDFLTALRPLRPDLRPGSLADPLKNCLAALAPQFEERRIQVTLDIPAALPNVALDPAQMEQVFFNILKNALEAMADGGTIDIALEADDHDVSASFRDSGSGMDAEQLAHLFEPYRTTKAHGTGLGLMVSKRIVTAHGGTIAATSRPGEGTAFTVILPRLERRIRELK